MLLEFSTSIAPLAFLLIVPAPLSLIPGPFGLAPPPSSTTFAEFSTRIPTLFVWIDVWRPRTWAPTCAQMWLSTIPVSLAVALPAIVRFESTNDFVRFVPSTDTATPFTLLIGHGPITNGSALVPLPDTTHWQLAKSPSEAITIGACPPSAPATPTPTVNTAQPTALMATT